MVLSQKQYALFVKQRAAASKTASDTFRACIVGGFVCVFGEFLTNLYMSFGISKQDSSTWTSLTLMAIAAVLTALHVFDNMARFAGAGTLVPITGFANSVVAPAIEYKNEGFVTGLAQKMFIIAGPVLVYGTFSAFCAGLIYYFFLI